MTDTAREPTRREIGLLAAVAPSLAVLVVARGLGGSLFGALVCVPLVATAAVARTGYGRRPLAVDLPAP